jgi:MoxR-like ATPase
MKYNILKFRPCSEALKFYNSFDTTEEAWEKCECGDWMLWIASKLQVDIMKLTLAKALCANTVRHLMEDKRSRESVYVAVRFGRGKATKEELASASASAAAAYAAAAAAYAASASAAAASASADAAAAYAAAAADADAAAADASADAASAASARKNNRMATAEICRKILTQVVFEKIKEV